MNLRREYAKRAGVFFENHPKITYPEWLESQLAEARDVFRAKKICKNFIDANVNDGEDRYDAEHDSRTFTPRDLQELIFEMLDNLLTPPTTNPEGVE